jgi:hypothetical protein
MDRHCRHRPAVHLALALGPWLIRPRRGPNGTRIALIIIVAVGVAVTSVPVVSKIFADLKILHTRFARLVLGVAVLEDIVLWLALALATGMAGRAELDPRQMSYHLIATIAFFGLGLTIVPRIVKKSTAPASTSSPNTLPWPAMAALLAYCVIADCSMSAWSSPPSSPDSPSSTRSAACFLKPSTQSAKSLRLLHPRLLRNRRLNSTWSAASF